MSITIEDCLKLTSLRKAKVIAGNGGLNKIVTAVTVLEHADYSILVDNLFLGNEIVISALVSIKDDVEAQCKVIHRLSEVGEVGLILYYVGIFVPKVGQQLLDVANELNFPLICMPTDRFDFRYSEVISEVHEAILKDKMQETYFVSSMINRVAQLQEHQRTMDAVLRMLSDHLRCTLFLCNRMYEQKSFASWPMASRWNNEEVIDIFKRNSALLVGEALPIELNGTVVYISTISVKTECFDMRLIAIDEAGELKSDDLQQVSEVIQLFVRIWKYDFEDESADALIKAILNDEPARIRQIAATLHIDISSINTMWVLKETEKKLSSEEMYRRNALRVIKVKMFLNDYRESALVDVFENDVVVFFNSSTFEELDKELSDEFIKSINKSDPTCMLITHPKLKTTADVRATYVLLEKVFEAAKLIYPSHRILDECKLRFAESCLAFIQQGEVMVENIVERLNPLQIHEDGDDLIKTLSIFLLDAQNNMQETGNYMYLHKNTVKYRINKIKQRLGYDVNKMPEIYNLYLAVALNRLLEGQMNK